MAGGSDLRSVIDRLGHSLIQTTESGKTIKPALGW
jgi:hypothetical protein